MKRRIFTVLFISVFATMLGFGIIEPLLPIYAQSIGASGTLIGIIFSAFMLSRAIFTPIIGRWSDKTGRRRFIIAGLFLYTIMAVAYIFAKDPLTLVLVRFLQGLTSALVVPVAMAYIGDIAPHGEEGRYFGIFTLALFLGMAAGPLLGGTVSHYFGMNSAFLTMALISLASLFLAYKVLPEIQRPAERPEPMPYKEILSDKLMRAILLFRAANAVGISGLMAFFPIFAIGIGMNTMQIGILVSVNLFTLSLLQPHFGKLADKYDQIHLLILGTVLFSLALLLIGFASDFKQLFAINALMGVGGAISVPASTAMTARMGKSMGMGSVIGIFSTAMSIGHTIGPIFAGLMYGLFSLTVIFFFLGALNLLASGIFYTWTRQRRV